jgi:hypothetical protein
MKFNNELQQVIYIEFTTFSALLLAIISTYKHWRILAICFALIAMISTFSVWNIETAISTSMIYIPMLILLWFEIDQRFNYVIDTRKQAILKCYCWIQIALGILLFISIKVTQIYLTLMV